MTTQDPYEEVDQFLSKEFPQIVMHGGESVITDLNTEEGTVDITLTGACDGCGINGMTSKALMLRLPQNIEWATKVDVSIKSPSEFTQ